MAPGEPMPRLRTSGKRTRYGYQAAPAADLAKAREMRADRATYLQIAQELGYSRAWAEKHTKDVELRPPKPGELAANRVRRQARLSMRARLLTQRGFDVPPSKQEEYTRLQRKGLAPAEIAKLLGLE